MKATFPALWNLDKVHADTCNDWYLVLSMPCSVYAVGMVLVAFCRDETKVSPVCSFCWCMSSGQSYRLHLWAQGPHPMQ